MYTKRGRKARMTTSRTDAMDSIEVMTLELGKLQANPARNGSCVAVWQYLSAIPFRKFRFPYCISLHHLLA